MVERRGGTKQTADEPVMAAMVAAGPDEVVVSADAAAAPLLKAVSMATVTSLLAAELGAVMGRRMVFAPSLGLPVRFSVLTVVFFPVLNEEGGLTVFVCLFAGVADRGRPGREAVEDAPLPLAGAPL